MSLYSVALQLVGFLLPWRLRRIVLNSQGWQVHKSATIGFSLIEAHEVVLAEHSRIGHLNRIVGLEKIQLEAKACIGNLNWVSGRLAKSSGIRSGTLCLLEGAAVSNRHYFDCNEMIEIGFYATVAGVRSQFFTHSIDLGKNRQRLAPISIGAYCFVGTGVILLPGAVLPEHSVLSAGSVLRKSNGHIASKSGLYSGNPATFERPLTSDEGYFVRVDPTVTL
jgi:acetyltransferase-like isoleucine patch superfamily enzyme